MKANRVGVTSTPSTVVVIVSHDTAAFGVGREAAPAPDAFLGGTTPRRAASRRNMTATDGTKVGVGRGAVFSPSERPPQATRISVARTSSATAATVSMPPRLGSVFVSTTPALGDGRAVRGSVVVGAGGPCQGREARGAPRAGVGPAAPPGPRGQAALLASLSMHAKGVI